MFYSFKIKYLPVMSGRFFEGVFRDINKFIIITIIIFFFNSNYAYGNPLRFMMLYVPQHNFLKKTIMMEEIKLMNEIYIKNIDLIDFYENKYTLFKDKYPSVEVCTDSDLENLSIDDLAKVDSCFSDILSVQESIIKRYSFLDKSMEKSVVKKE